MYALAMEQDLFEMKLISMMRWFLRCVNASCCRTDEDVRIDMSLLPDSETNLFLDGERALYAKITLNTWLECSSTNSV